MVGLPQPRLIPSLKPISFSSAAEYEPLQPQSGPSAWQQPASAMVCPAGIRAICLAALAYRERTASLNSLISALLPLIDECRWVHRSTYPSTFVNGLGYYRLMALIELPVVRQRGVCCGLPEVDASWAAG